MLYPDDVNYWKEVAEKHAERVKELEDELAIALDKLDIVRGLYSEMVEDFKSISDLAGRHL